MKKYLIFGLLLIIVFSAILVLAAKPDMVVATNNKAGNENKLNTVVIPTHAVEVADGVFSLGMAQDIDGRAVEGFLFVYRGGNAKPDGTPGGGKGGGKKGGGGSNCYTLFAKGAKWKTVESYITGSGVDTTLTQASLGTWNAQSNIFGARDTTGTTDGADSASPDGKNEVMLENLGATSTIAYTIVWGIFSGPPRGRELVEWDAVFNTNYAWSLTGEAGKMDYQNIATHEFGHATGLGHPEDTCIEETMYAYADFGETKKRTLEAGDIEGVLKLYS